LSFASGILCAGLFAVSCKPRNFNAGSEVKGAGDIASMEKDPATGLYTVTCTNGTKETKVTQSQIQSGEVCKAAPPQGASSIIADFSGTYTVMCKDGSIEQAVSKARVDSGDYCKQKPSPTVTQVNPKAFNAFLLWRDGKGTPILDYPAGYDVQEGKSDPDGMFYVAPSTFWQDDKFIGSVTEGAKVEGDLLIYPTKEGRALALRFSAPAEKKMTHANAVQHCKAKGLRLSHIQELYDFCAAGTAKNASGYYDNNRCADGVFWSASMYSVARFNAWQFSGYSGDATYNNRDYSYGVRCVGMP
jgi:hypothetical protein